MSIDTDKVIMEVRLRPLLWDFKDEAYKQRESKIKAWREVCQKAIPNFDDLSDIEKKLTEKQVQQRWKTARDAYVRSKTNDDGKRKKYMYYDYMHFLDKNDQEVAKDFKIGTQKSTDSFENSEKVSQNLLEDCLSNMSSPTPEAPIYAAPTTSRTTAPSRRYHAKLQRLKKLQRRRKMCVKDDEDFKKEMLVLFKENMSLMHNDDMLFFCSLLPITQTFDNYQKLFFRSEVLKKAMEVSNFKCSEPLEMSNDDT